MRKSTTISTPLRALILLTVLTLVPAMVVPATAQEGTAKKEAPASTNPRVTLETTLGTIVLELFPDKAPKTVENFLGYAESGFYEGTLFHRVIPGFMIQGGGFSGDFQQKETRAPVENESDNGLSNTRGTVAMARTSDPHSATSQFFINVVDNPSLNHSSRGWGYTVFGKVVKGMDVADAISKVPTTRRGPMSDVPREPVVIDKVTVENAGGDG
jgi:cyclophilin family peptidyl-prolyl cis-trans isomerase